MPLASNEPKGRHWENVALPIIGTLTPGTYNNPQITVDEYGRILLASSGAGGSGFGAQDSGTPVIGGPFNTLNFAGSNTNAVLGAPGTLDITVTSAGSVIALDEGVPIVGGPFSSINLVGPDIVGTDAGGGQLDLTVFTGGGARHQFVKEFGGIAATQDIGFPINPLGVVREVTVSIIVPYTAGVTVEVTDGAGNVLLASSSINAQLLGSYTLVTPENTTAIVDPQIRFVVSGAPTAGNAVVEVIYQTA